MQKRSKKKVSQDVIGYLPTIDAPATDVVTVHKVQSLKIKNSLQLKSIVLMFDQALYTKASEIQWKQSERFKDGSTPHSQVGHNWQVLPRCWLERSLR